MSLKAIASELEASGVRCRVVLASSAKEKYAELLQTFMQKQKQSSSNNIISFIKNTEDSYTEISLEAVDSMDRRSLGSSLSDVAFSVFLPSPERLNVKLFLNVHENMSTTFLITCDPMRGGSYGTPSLKNSVTFSGGKLPDSEKRGFGFISYLDDALEELIVKNADAIKSHANKLANMRLPMVIK